MEKNKQILTQKNVETNLPTLKDHLCQPVCRVLVTRKLKGGFGEDKETDICIQQALLFTIAK